MVKDYNNFPSTQSSSAQHLSQGQVFTTKGESFTYNDDFAITILNYQVP